MARIHCKTQMRSATILECSPNATTTDSTSYDKHTETSAFIVVPETSVSVVPERHQPRVDIVGFACVLHVVAGKYCSDTYMFGTKWWRERHFQKRMHLADLQNHYKTIGFKIKTSLRHNAFELCKTCNVASRCSPLQRGAHFQ